MATENSGRNSKFKTALNGERLVV